MEDFNILMKDPVTGEYQLQASATLFPAGWELQERIGTSLANLHAPVPGWGEDMARYEGVDVWGKLVLGWCEKRLGRNLRECLEEKVL
jgi:hypothetical protein